MGKEGKAKEGEIRRGVKPREALGNNLRVSGGGGGRMGSPVLGIKEVMCCSVHWVLYANNESWNTISKTNDVLYGG